MNLDEKIAELEMQIQENLFEEEEIVAKIYKKLETLQLKKYLQEQKDV